MSVKAETKHTVCPWWMGSLLDNPIRRMIHPADKMLGRYVKEGMTALDFGCGFGHFSLGMARLTGPSGRVIAADVQPQMLKKTAKRAVKHGLCNIETHLCGHNSTGIDAEPDFILMSCSLHETPDTESTLREMFTLLKPAGKMLVLEPGGHGVDFETEIKAALDTGFVKLEQGKRFMHSSALFTKPEAGE